MTDLDAAAGDQTPLVPSDATPSTMIKFALKNGAGEIEVDTAKLPERQYLEALKLGLKAMAERAMSKITKEAYPVEAERQAAIKAKAKANIADVYADKAKVSGETKAKASGARREVVTEAMRLAKNLVKDALRAKKIKLKDVKASQITAWAKQLVESDPTILTTAEANLKARETMPVKIDLMSLVKADDTLVAQNAAKAEAEKASKPLSKTQAGKAAPRVAGRKGQTAQPTA